MEECGTIRNGSDAIHVIDGSSTSSTNTSENTNCKISDTKKVTKAEEIELKEKNIRKMKRKLQDPTSDEFHAIAKN